MKFALSSTVLVMSALTVLARPMDQRLAANMEIFANYMSDESKPYFQKAFSMLDKAWKSTEYRNDVEGVLVGDFVEQLRVMERKFGRSRHNEKLMKANLKQNFEDKNGYLPNDAVACMRMWINNIDTGI